MRYSLPAVVMLSKPSLPVGIFQSIIWMLKGLIPKKTRFPCVLGGLVLSATIVSSICCITFWEEMEMEKERENVCRLSVWLFFPYAPPHLQEPSFLSINMFPALYRQLKMLLEIYIFSNTY